MYGVHRGVVRMTSRGAVPVRSSNCAQQRLTDRLDRCQDRVPSFVAAQKRKACSACMPTFGSDDHVTRSIPLAKLYAGPEDATLAAEVARFKSNNKASKRGMPLNLTAILGNLGK